MKRCARCVLPSTVPGITFDQDGICSFCQAYKPAAAQGEGALLDLIASARTGTGRYDCIVPLSGGRDSTYVLYMAAAKYKLRVLAVTYDNEFRVEQAERNIETACRILGVDHVRIRSRQDIARKMVHHAVRMAVPFGFKATEFPYICGACGYGYLSAAYRAAEQHHVPLIFWGDSDEENTASMHEVVSRAEEGMGRVHEEMRKRRRSTPSAYIYRYYDVRQRAEFPVPGNSLLSRESPKLRNPSIREVHFFNYVPWDRTEIKNVITDKLGWRKPDDYASSWRFDCVLHSVANYIHVLNYGCTKDCFGYCRMINSGRMSREEALAQEELAVAHATKGVRQILQERVGISPGDVSRLAGKDGVDLP